jgi:sulfur-oxidizing protein SoxA
MKKQLVKTSIFIAISTVAILIAITLSAQKTESISKDDLSLYSSGINPAETMIDECKKFLGTKRGPKNQSCLSCHEKPEKDFKGVATTYPKITKSAKTMVSLQKQINVCINSFAPSKTIPLGSYEMTSMALYIKSLSNGMPVNVKIDGDAKEWYELGELVYNQRRGQRNLSCKVCHDILPGTTLRMQKLSPIGTGASHWPAYRMKKGNTYLIEQRFRQCMKNARMKKLKAGSVPLTALELYITHKAQGAKIDVPGWVR